MDAANQHDEAICLFREVLEAQRVRVGLDAEDSVNTALNLASALENKATVSRGDTKGKCFAEALEIAGLLNFFFFLVFFFDECFEMERKKKRKKNEKKEKMKRK